MRTISQGGFTLIELLIAISIFAFLIVIAGPMYADFMNNTQVRNGAESVLAGVRLAQADAVKGNTQSEFVLDTTAGGGWQVLRLNPETGAFDIAVQSYKWSDGASRTSVDASGKTRVTFDGLGRIMQTNPDGGSAPITRIDVTPSTAFASQRPLSIVIGFASPSATSGIKLCDPNPNVATVDPHDPRICPST
jgi:type IV fimbrial biogenesis protein FimT